MTVLKGCLRTNRSDFSFERESNGWANDGAKGADGARGAKGGEEKGQRGEGAENERRAKLTKWGG